MSGTPLVIVTGERVVIVTRATLGKSKVVVFDADTGTIIWESSPIDNLSSLAADNHHVYVGAIRNVQAYDLSTGQLLWEGAKQDINKRGGLNVYAESNQLNVYDPSGNRLYILDAETGETIQEIDYPALYFVKGNIYLSDACSSNLRVMCLNATEGINGNLLWSHDFNAEVHIWPVFIDDKFFINSAGDIFAIDVQTGDIKWDFTQDNYITGLALGDNQLYAIRNDAAIVRFDPETGEQVGIIELAPKQDIEYKGGEVPYTPYYTIAASDKFVAAYYSNSQELIVFERVEE
jgi:outer membrane protein assembly factor BamB